MIDDAIEELIPLVGVTAACRPRAAHYRWHRKSPLPPKPKRMPTPQPWALDDVERKEILRVLHEPQHVDEAPATANAKLLDEGVYWASTMFRILHGEGEVSEHRSQAAHPARVIPELVAGGPNEVWSWHTTKLLGPVKWTYCYRYVSIDIYSRYPPSWMLAHIERATSLSGCWLTRFVPKVLSDIS